MAKLSRLVGFEHLANDLEACLKTSAGFIWLSVLNWSCHIMESGTVGLILDCFAAPVYHYGCSQYRSWKAELVISHAVNYQPLASGSHS